MAELTVPQINFAPLGQLGKIYKESVNEQGLKDAFSQGVGNDPQSLAALAQKVAPYNPQMGINLAQLAHTIGRQGTQDARQQGLDTFNQNIEREKLELSKRASARADEGPEETATQRAAAAQKFGIKPTDPGFKPFVLTGKLPEADTSFLSAVEQRKVAAQGLGMTPEHPAYNSFVATGKMPREDAQPLTATDKKAVMEADEGVLSAQTAIEALQKAKELSPKAYSGWKAAERGYAASFLGPTSDTGKAGLATVELDNVVKTNALSQLKSIFGGNPTEGEREILLQIQGSSSMSPEARAAVFERAKKLAEVRLNFNKQRANELRGGQFYKPQGGKPATQAAPAETALADPLGIR